MYTDSMNADSMNADSMYTDIIATVLVWIYYNPIALLFNKWGLI